MPLGFKDILIANMEEFKHQENEIPPAGLSKEELMHYLMMRAANNSETMKESTEIINTNLMPLLKNPENMTTDQADDLYALAVKLFTVNSQLDIGLSLEIHKTLIEYSKLKNDLLRTVRSQYYAGLILFSLNSSYVRMRKKQLVFVKKSLGIFLEAAANIDNYKTIENKEVRMFINRCLGNIYVVSSRMRHGGMPPEDLSEVLSCFLKHVDDALIFWMREDIRAVDPDFPWDMFINNAHQNVTGWLDVLRKQHPDQIDHVLASRVYESFELLVQENAPIDINKYWPEMRTEYTSIATKYYIGQKSLEESTNALRDLMQKADINDYSDNGQYASIYIPLTIIGFLLDNKHKNQKDIQREIEELSQYITSYIKNAPSGANKASLNNYLAQYMYAIGSKLPMQSHVSTQEYIDLLLRFTAYGNLTTYAHSLQVKSIVEVLSCHFIRLKPELFVGILGTKTVKDVLENKDEILQMASRAALCHDIGKIYFYEMVSLCSRSLFEYELDIIKEHTSIQKLPAPTENDALFHCILDIIQGHHKWYDGKGGYPADFDNTKSPNKFIIDMVSIADSIDAATDAIGRSHANVLELEQVIDEIQGQAGTRYCPIVAEALKNKDVISKIRYCIKTGRKNAYYEAYLGITQ
ncbi:MAG: hypothetical protein FWE44_02685 [Defluviitaleaceae bacterium]|nr:hypothetical protein [Defluviitaleaceae bacterium]